PSFLEGHLTQIGNRSSTNDDLFAVASFRETSTFMPDNQPDISSRHELDLELAVAIRNGKIRMIENADVCLHPEVNATRNQYGHAILAQPFDCVGASGGNQHVISRIDQR